MSKIKYVICPGELLADDGDVHFITAKALINLYQVAPKDCVVQPQGENARGLPEDVIFLHPRRDGNYTVPVNTEGTKQ
jgi:hypothetical protein